MTAGTLRRVCAWCRAVLDGGPPVTRAEPVTHGICAPCSSAFLAGISDELTDRTREEELLASDDDDRDPDGDFTR